jgi:uncharacterized membrane protein YdjX (TVP38/TMEM64 family)
MIAGVLLAWRLGYFELANRDSLLSAITSARQMRWAAPTLALVFVAAVAFNLPTTVLTVLAGAVFGFARGAALAWMSAIVGTALVHRLTRSLADGSMRRRLQSHRLARRLQGEASVARLMQLRVMPLAPFGVLPYLAGIVGVPSPRLLLATALAVIPSTVAYAYLGDQLHAALVDPANSAAAAIIAAGVVTAFVSGLAIAAWLHERIGANRD